MTLVSERILKDRYELVEVLGEGGMSVVYLARDANLPGREWAVKEVFPDPCNEEDGRLALEAFEGEARVLGALDNPGIPRIVDAFFEGGRGYLVMERVPGRDLQSLIDEKGRWREDEALQLGLDICAILRYLHERPEPVIFRDLKASNVMITPDDRVVLIDFGIARHFRSQRRKDTVAIGTLGYAPPEQYSAAVPPDARADIYALGALLYFVLTGRDPQHHAPFDFPPLREFIPDVGRETAAAVDRALSYDAAQRPASVADMETLLRSALQAWKDRRDPLPARRRRWPLAAAALLVALFGGATYFATRGSAPPPPVVDFAPAVVPQAIGTVGTFAVPMSWRTFDFASDLPAPMGRPLLLFGKGAAWVVMARPGGAAGVGSYGDTVELDAGLSRVLAAPSLQYWGAPSCVLDDQDRLLVSDVRGVSRVDGPAHRLLWVPEGRTADSAMEMRAAPAARLFRGGDGSPYVVYQGGFARMGEEGPVDHRHVEGTRVVAAPYATSPPADWLPHDPRTFWVDAQGALWLEDGRGLARIAVDGAVTRFDEVPTDGLEVLFSTDRLGTVLAVNGAARTSDGQPAAMIYRVVDARAVALPVEGSVQQLVEAPGGYAFALTSKGLFRVEEAAVVQQSAPWQGGGRWIGALDAQGRYWFWGPSGLFRLQDGKWARGEFKHWKKALPDAR